MIGAIIEAGRAAWQSIVAHGFRSLLTMLGIIIGVASVIAVISLVQGLRESITAEFQSLGSNALTVRSYTPFKRRLEGQVSRITVDDYQLIVDRVSDVETITPVLFSEGAAGELSWGSQTTFSQVQGTTHSFQDVANLYAARGRFLSPADNSTRRRVAVLGPQVVEDLEMTQPVGEFLTIGGEWIKVVGVMEARGELFGRSQDDYVLLPFETMRSMNGVQVEPDIVMQLAVASSEAMGDVTNQIRAYLRKSHNLAPTADDDFRIQTPEQIAESLDQIINTVTVIIGGIVAISLLVGGIGIMNIMLVSVTERTREIGICKALGARRRDILLQFLIEALLLSLLGGVLGLLLGYGLGALVASLVPNFPPATVPLWAIALALGFSGAIGVLFGLLPASKAADLNPIDALRYE
ncbi:MAG: ABC transporter permease [Pseudomonadota bacterium]